MFETFQKDLDKKKFTDTELTFVCSSGSRSIACHRIVLASVLYFYNLFTTFDDSLAQKEFIIHVDDSAIAHDFVLSLYQLENQADYPSWLRTLKMIKLRDFFCLDSDVSQLYNLVVPAEGFELLIETVKLFKLADVMKDKKLLRMLMKILPTELIAANFTQDLLDLISQKNKYFLVAGKNIELRNLESKEVVKTFTGCCNDQDWILSLLLVDNQHFLSASEDRTIKLWNVTTGQCVRKFDGPFGHTGGVRSLILVDSQHFLSGSCDQTIKLWNVESGRCVFTFGGPLGHTDYVNLLLLVDNQHFLSGSWDNTIKLWNIESGFVRTFAGPHSHTDRVSSLVLVDNQHFLSASADGKIKLWNIASGKHVRTFAGPLGHAISVMSLLLVDDQHFLSGSADNTIKLWNLDSGKCVRTFAGPNGHTRWIISLILLPDNQHFLSASADKTIKLWNIESGECIETTTVEKTPRFMILYEERS